MVQAGQTELRSAGPYAATTPPGTTQCKLIKFEKSFAATVEPIVLGSIDRNSKMHDSSLMAKMDTDTDDAHVPVTFWIENINRIEFKVLDLLLMPGSTSLSISYPAYRTFSGVVLSTHLHDACTFTPLIFLVLTACSRALLLCI
jgi:hypothetical protein